MTRFHPLAIALAAVLLATPALAQRGEGLGVEVNPYGGVFLLDDSELRDAFGWEANIGGMLGGRLGVTIDDDWLIEGSYGWASVTLEPAEFQDFPDPDVETDLGVHLVHASVGYRIGTDVAPTELVLSAGVGGMWIDPEVGESDGDFMVTLGAGFLHPVNEWIVFKGDFRDHVSFCSAPEREETELALCTEEEPLHHLEISGGLQFYLY